MLAVHFILSLIAGALICNSIPHLAAGLRGEWFPTPFAKPAGIALSSPELNVFWGSANLLIGLALNRHVWLGFAIGFLLTGYFLARHFGKVRARNFIP